MNQSSSFPEYRDAGLTRDSREHLLGALDYGKQAHEALLHCDRRAALIKIDMLIALAHEARKPLLTAKSAPIGQSLASMETASTQQLPLKP